MNKVEIIKKGIKGFSGNAWLVKKGKEYFVVSGANTFDRGWEVLVFPADKDGNVTSWLETCGGVGITHEEAIRQLDNK